MAWAMASKRQAADFRGSRDSGYATIKVPVFWFQRERARLKLLDTQAINHQSAEFKEKEAHIKKQHRIR